MKRFKQFKRGATSFYIVAFSTLILVIIAASFATVMISEITRTSNDDLSQSAYDSALAGVEDAKLAYANYQRCIANNPSLLDTVSGLDSSGGVSCNNIVYWMKNPSCDMVAKMLGRAYVEGQGVLISETIEGDNMMSQYDTCVQINTKLSNYRANLTSDNNVRIVKVQFDNGMSASAVKKLKFSWYMKDARETSLNFSNFNGSRVTFYPVGEQRPSTPPTLVLQLVQTAGNFQLGGYNEDANSGHGLNGIAVGDNTDRATLFLVPTNNESAASGNATGSGAYTGVYKGSKNFLTADQVAKTNSQAATILPYVVYCGDTTADFACSVEIELPDPVGGQRNDDTFMFLVTLPYGEPDTDFAMEFYCGEGASCPNAQGDVNDNSGAATMANTQVSIDSTGRANDLFRRVETRIESSDTSFPYTYYALELFGNGDTLKKNMTVLCENNFYDRGTNVVYTGSGLPSGAWGELGDGGSGNGNC